MKTFTRRLWSLLLCVCLLAGNVSPAAALESEEQAGSRFALAVLTADGIVIEPAYISYEDGETIAQALLRSGYEFTGLENGWIQAVEGASDSYSLFYDENGYDLTAPADSITALCITTKTDNYSAEYLGLIKAMADFNTATSGVQAYTDAAEAYGAAERMIYTATAAAAEELRLALTEAMADYERFAGGELVRLMIDVPGMEEGSLTGQFGNTYETDGETELLVAPGEYQFDLSDGGRNHVRGSITVDSDTTLTARLPQGQWLDSMELSTANGGDWQAVQKTGEWTFAVPDYAGRNLYPYFEPGEDVDTSSCAMYLGDGSKRVWRSHETVLARVIEGGSMGGTVLELEARQGWGGYEQYQTYPIEILRVPSLSELTVYSEGTKLPVGFDPAMTEYSLAATGESVDVMAAALNDGTAITVNGTALSEGRARVVLDDGVTEIDVTITHENGLSCTYALEIEKLSSVEVRIETEADSAEVFNEAGASIAPVDGVYALVPGESYRYVTTTDEYYHTSGQFTAAEGLTVHAPEPETEDALASLKVAAALKAEPYGADRPFSPDIHEYTYQVGSNETNFGIMAQLSGEQAEYTMTAYYDDYRTWNPSYAGRKNTAVSGLFKAPGNFLGASGIGNVLTLRIEKTVDDVCYYQDYILTAQRKLQLNDMSLSSNGQPLVLERGDGTAGFSKFVTDYSAQIGQTMTELELSVKLFGSAAGNDNGVLVTVRRGDWSRTLDYTGLAVNENQTVTVALDPRAEEETVVVTLEREGATAQTYTIRLNKLPPVETVIGAEPAGALVYLTDDVTGARILPQSSGTYILDAGKSYTYTVTRYGYKTQRDSFIAGTGDAVSVALTKAPESTLKDIALDTDYLSFRGNGSNNAITGAPTPIAAEEAVLNWANKLGAGTSGGGVGSPIIVGGDLYTYAGNTVYRIDRLTGEVLASAAMDHTSSFSITPPAYGEGMIFVALANGGIQAFHAETLESLWVYEDQLSGQPNCPVVYKDGFIYTGFWNAEEKRANFVCISVTDEDPSQPGEEKLPAWVYTHNGFYWAGAYVAEEHLLVTTDDGANGYTAAFGAILSLDPGTGVLLDELVMPNVGDLRSSVCYDEETGAYYFTSKGGDFYAVEVNADGTFREGSLKRLPLTNGSDSGKNPPMSTSTPVVYNGRAYIGVSGTGQFVAYSGHNITVVDLKNWKIAYTVPTQGYPQTSGLLTTAYEAETEYVYVYFLDNYTPGKLRVIRDTAGQNAFDTGYSTTETYSVSGKSQTIETGYVLFTPSGAQAQYAICSPIVDEYGNLYFKNDSGYLMCLGSTIQELIIGQQPETTVYEAGQVFDGTGMKVTAVYANGVMRDVTKFAKYSSEPLRADDTELTVSLDFGSCQQMYQDRDGEAGAEYHIPGATVDLTINTAHSWDAGKVTKEASVIAGGERVYTCTVCGEEEREVIPMLQPCDGGESCVGKDFTDWAGPGHWAHAGMDYGVEKGLLKGVGGGKFDPDGELTRAMLVTILWRYAGAEDVGFGDFTDVAPEEWYAKSVAWAAKYGIVMGTGNNEFSPDDKITREQIAAILYRYAEHLGLDTSARGDFSKFADGEKVSGWAVDAMQWATASGILSGSADNGKLYLNPGDNATRAQAAKLIMCYIELILK